MRSRAANPALFVALFFPCIFVVRSSIAVEAGVAHSEGCDVAIKIKWHLAPPTPPGPSHPALLSVVTLNGDLLLNETLQPFQDRQYIPVSVLPYGDHEIKAYALRGGQQVVFSELIFTLNRDVVLPALYDECAGGDSPDASCGMSQPTFATPLLPGDVHHPQLWVIMNDWHHHANLIALRNTLTFQHPDGTVPALRNIIARGTISRQTARYVCAASVLVRLYYVREIGADEMSRDPRGYSVCSRFLLTTELLPPFQRNGINVSTVGTITPICFATRGTAAGGIMTLDLNSNVSTNILIDASCPPHCSASPTEIHLQSQLTAVDELILPARSHTYTISLLCPSTPAQHHALETDYSSLACQCAAYSCTPWSPQMVGPVYLTPRNTSITQNVSASGARIASAYEVYWVYVNNIAGGIMWHPHAAAPDGYLSLNTLGHGIFKGCGVCHDGQVLRFAYPIDFSRDLKDAFEIVPAELAPPSCFEHVFMTLPHRPRAAPVHNLMHQEHSAFVSGMAWTMRSCQGTCECDDKLASDSGTVAGAHEWKYNDAGDVIEFLDQKMFQQLPAAVRSRIGSSIYEITSNRQALVPLIHSSSANAARDDDAIIETFMDNAHLPYASATNIPSSHLSNDEKHVEEAFLLHEVHPKAPRIAALVFGELRVITRENFEKFESAVTSSVGADSIDLFLVLRPFQTPRCLEGLCSPCSIAEAMLRNVKKCLHYDVPRSERNGAQGAAHPAGISRATGPIFSRKWQNSGSHERFESSSLGSPPGWYLWQPLQLAFSLVLAEERALLSRYSYVVRLRLDRTLPALRPAAQWDDELSPHRAYVRGHVNAGGRLSESGDQTLILGRERVSRCDSKPSLMTPSRSRLHPPCDRDFAPAGLCGSCRTSRSRALTSLFQASVRE
jgi:hypothetical protein